MPRELLRIDSSHLRQRRRSALALRHMRLFSLAMLGGLVVFLSMPALTLAQAVVSASPDVTIDLGAGVIASDDDVAVDNQMGVVLLENLGTLPATSDVVALGLGANGDRLIAFDTTTSLAGGVIARMGDVARYDGANYSIEFDASVAGLPESVGTDAVSLSPGGLLLSFDTTVSLPGGLIAADEDLVEWDGAAFNILLSGSSAGIDASLDLDGGQALGGGVYYVSFDTAGTVGGVAFSDEDVLRYDGVAWSLEVDSSAINSAWSAADLDAVMVPEPTFAGMLVAGALGLWAIGSRRRQSD